MRLNRYLARSGFASRRKSEESILSGQVSINGKIVTDLATKVNPEVDKVTVNGIHLILPQFKYLLLNKPAGYTCTRRDPHAEKTVYELLPDDPSLFVVGRLDRETTGLLLVTNDGDFAQNIIHPSKKIRKTYQITLTSPLNKDQLNKLQKPIPLEDGPAVVKVLKKLSDDRLELEIEEGRKRIVRRIIEATGNKVLTLHRVMVGQIKLDVPSGKYRPLSAEEVSQYV